MKENDNKVNQDHFFEFFQDRLEFVKSTCIERIEGMILLCSYIDSLAGYRYDEKNNKDRFRRFLVNDTEQGEEWKKISIVELKYHISKKSEESHVNLLNILNRLDGSLLDSFNLHRNPDIASDLLLERCKSEMSIQAVELYEKDIMRFEYANILWKDYRNLAIHETRYPKDKAENLIDKSVPFYTNRGVEVDGKMVLDRTCFAIPNTFLVTTIESGLGNLKKLVQSGKLNLKR